MDTAQNEQHNDRRRFKRHTVQLTGDIRQSSEDQRCLVLDLSVNGALLQCPSEILLGRPAQLQIDGVDEAVEVTPAWNNGPFIGVECLESHTGLSIHKRKNKIVAWLTSPEAKAIELSVGVLGLLVAAATLMYVAVETRQISAQNVLQTNELELQTKQLKVQTIRQVEDSERFINQLLVEKSDLREILGDKDDELQGIILGHIFLQEWEKVYRFQEIDGVVDEDYWNSYKEIISSFSQKDIIQSILKNDASLSGYHPVFVKFMKQYVK